MYGHKNRCAYSLRHHGSVKLTLMIRAIFIIITISILTQCRNVNVDYLISKDLTNKEKYFKKIVIGNDYSLISRQKLDTINGIVYYTIENLNRDNLISSKDIYIIDSIGFKVYKNLIYTYSSNNTVDSNSRNIVSENKYAHKWKLNDNVLKIHSHLKNDLHTQKVISITKHLGFEWVNYKDKQIKAFKTFGTDTIYTNKDKGIDTLVISTTKYYGKNKGLIQTINHTYGVKIELEGVYSSLDSITNR